MAANLLALNPGKIEILWVSSPRWNYLIDRKPFVIGDVEVVPSMEVHLLRVLLDESLSFVGPLSNVTQVCYLELRKILEIQRYISTATAILLVRAYSL